MLIVLWIVTLISQVEGQVERVKDHSGRDNTSHV